MTGITEILGIILSKLEKGRLFGGMKEIDMSYKRHNPGIPAFAVFFY